MTGDEIADGTSPLPPRRLVRGSRNLRGLVGSTLLVGITFVDEAGKVLRRDQAVGVVTEAADGVVTLRRADGEEVHLPADEPSYRPAPPGRYRLVGSGEEVVDPDALCTWTVMVHQE